MKKLVALETIKGMFSGIIYAHKHDELEFINNHDDEIGYYRNLRTREPFHCKTEKVGEIEQSEFFLFVEHEETKKTSSKTAKRHKEDDINSNQIKMF
jgi:hypothetical protein